MSAKQSLDCQATMLHAFDLPLTARDYRLIAYVCAGEITNQNIPFRMSLSVKDGKLILGFENTANGNRMTIVYSDIEHLDLPEWMSANTNFVTKDAISMIDLGYYARLHDMSDASELQTVAILSLEGLWVANNIDWTLRQHHLTGEDQLKNDLTQLVTINPGRFIGGIAVVNANGHIEAEPIAQAVFKTAGMAKTLLGKAGKSKPQGDLIVYFSRDSCAAEGYNSVGETTLELSSVGGNRQISAYESTIENDTIMGVKFGYPFYFRALFSARDGFLTPTQLKDSTINYGVTEHERPYLAIHMPNDGKVIQIVMQSEQGVFKADDLTLPELSLSNKSTKSVTKTVTPTNTTTSLTWDDLEIDYPEEYEEEIKHWFDSYSEGKTITIENINMSVSTWFSSFLMKSAREGTPVSVRDRDAYREVTRLLE